MGNGNRREEDEEAITPTRVLTIEHDVANIKGSIGYLKDTIEANELKTEAFQKIVLEKLDGKSDFDLLKTMKIVISTIVIMGASITALDYRMDSKLSVPISDGTHRDTAILTLQENNDHLMKRMSTLEITANNTKKEVAGNSAFVDHYQYTAKTPIHLNTLDSDVKMLQYRIIKLEGSRNAK